MIGYEDVPSNHSPAAVWVDANNQLCQHVSFHVAGLPKPKGNLIKGRWGGYHDPTKGLDTWLEQLVYAAATAMAGTGRQWVGRDGKVVSGADAATLAAHGAHRAKLAAHSAPNALPPFDGPVHLQVSFVLPRPKATPKRRTPPAIKKPDLDKLLRAVCDALSGPLWLDDAQVVQITAAKRLAALEESTGVVVSVSTAHNGEPGAASAAGAIKEWRGPAWLRPYVDDEPV